MNRRLPTLLSMWMFCIGVFSCAPQDDAPKGATSAGPSTAVAPEPAAPPMDLKPRLDAALEDVHGRDLYTTHGFWTIFHGILGMGPDTTLYDTRTKERFNALDYICQGKEIRGMKFIRTPDGADVVTMIGSGIGQGHQDQFVAEMAQWDMPTSRKFLVEGQSCLFADFVQHSKQRASVTRDQELSWALVILAQYYGTDLRWTNTLGEKLSVDDVVRYELDQPIDTAACGGTHRLFGLTWAYHLHRVKGGKTEGVWKEVADRIALYKGKALQYQNGDGSFGSGYVSKPGLSRELQVRIATTGHVLEWLALAMTDDELRGPKMQEAASALAAMILQNQNNPLDGGALYHATHGLHLYRTRVFGTTPPRGLLIPPTPKS